MEPKKRRLPSPAESLALRLAMPKRTYEEAMEQARKHKEARANPEKMDTGSSSMNEMNRKPKLSPELRRSLLPAKAHAPEDLSVLDHNASSGSTPRAVISWFGWGIENIELFSEETCREWMHRVQALAEAREWVVERLGNNIDLVIGRSGHSILPIEFFDFQREWELLNEEFEFRFSGVLWLMGEHHETLGDDAPSEMYVRGQKKHGDSIGRPQRHRIRRD